jgi:hypothetical protein
MRPPPGHQVPSPPVARSRPGMGIERTHRSSLSVAALECPRISRPSGRGSGAGLSPRPAGPPPVGAALVRGERVPPSSPARPGPGQRRRDPTPRARRTDASRDPRHTVSCASDAPLVPQDRTGRRRETASPELGGRCAPLSAPAGWTRAAACRAPSPTRRRGKGQALPASHSRPRRVAVDDRCSGAGHAPDAAYRALLAAPLPAKPANHRRRPGPHPAEPGAAAAPRVRSMTGLLQVAVPSGPGSAARVRRAATMQDPFPGASVVADLP